VDDDKVRVPREPGQPEPLFTVLAMTCRSGSSSAPMLPASSRTISGMLPLLAALIQGLRDYFGSHTYARVDRAGTFHADWAGDAPEHRVDQAL
jgi:hypothetical protein